jgi:hypothetical protein
MTFGATVVRVVIGLIGFGLMVAGLLTFFLGGPGAGLFAGSWLVLTGVILVVAVLIEVGRYRSQQAERERLTPGPGGGEPGPLEPRFQPSDEVFVDPTTERRMRVWVDPRTGERRYVAEG